VKRIITALALCATPMAAQAQASNWPPAGATFCHRYEEAGEACTTPGGWAAPGWIAESTDGGKHWHGPGPNEPPPSAEAQQDADDVRLLRNLLANYPPPIALQEFVEILYRDYHDCTARAASQAAQWQCGETLKHRNLRLTLMKADYEHGRL
jgi:hypothetical protein